MANYNKAMGISFEEALNGQIGDFLINDGGASQELLSLNNFFAPNGQLSSVFTNSWNFHNNVGAVYNVVTRSENDVITLNGSTSFTLVPGRVLMRVNTILN